MNLDSESNIIKKKIESLNLYIMCIIAVWKIYGYVKERKIDHILLFVTICLTIHHFSGNIAIAILVGLIILSFVSGCGNILEGWTLIEHREIGDVVILHYVENGVQKDISAKNNWQGCEIDK